jgi:hypothetical protein
MACNAPRHPWHLWQRRPFRICNLQNLKGLTEFESHPLRHSTRLRLAYGEPKARSWQATYRENALSECCAERSEGQREPKGTLLPLEASDRA